MSHETTSATAGPKASPHRGRVEDKEQRYACQAAQAPMGAGGSMDDRTGERRCFTGQGRIAYRFHARDLHLVLGRVDAAHRCISRCCSMGEPPGADHGADVDKSGRGAVREQRLYQLIRQGGAVTDRLFEIEFLEPGARPSPLPLGRISRRGLAAGGGAGHRANVPPILAARSDRSRGRPR